MIGKGYSINPPELMAMPGEAFRWREPEEAKGILHCPKERKLSKRLFVVKSPKELSDWEVDIELRRWHEALKECGITAKVLILDNGWDVEEFYPDGELATPEEDDG